MSIFYKRYNNCRFRLMRIIIVRVIKEKLSIITVIIIYLFINDLYSPNSRKLLFADNVKFLRIIKPSSDSILLQNNLNLL